ncbi:hypothetical protein ACEN32_05240 [Marinilactibacillus psychrotolerans]|uniref:hypothetical protein n=1 Tax=Marinilactibacillus psychrotolerans TaxID=191770 RepID=UPI00388460A1
MKIGKKFLVKLSLSFIIVGITFSFLGFALSGFDTDSYQVNQDKWYRVVHFE